MANSHIILPYGIPKLIVPDKCDEVQHVNARADYLYYSNNGTINDLSEDIKTWFMLKFGEKVQFREPTFLLNMSKANVSIPIRRCPCCCGCEETEADCSIELDSECEIVELGSDYDFCKGVSTDCDNEIKYITDLNTNVIGQYTIYYYTDDGAYAVKRICVEDDKYDHEYDYGYGATDCCESTTYDHEYDYEYCEEG